VNKSDIRRRWLGVVCLGIAILMVVWGQFFLPRSLAPTLQAAFWLLCFVFTIAAILIALVDLLVLRQRTRAEKRALFAETMDAIEKEAAHTRMQH
jgi:TRAP-type C4-dicarboxylate transport system permease small subunit